MFLFCWFLYFQTKQWHLEILLYKSFQLGSWASLVAQIVKTLPAVRDTWVPSLGWQDPVEEGMNTPSSILAWRILMDRGAWQATVHGVTKS